jgi:hypothetical protein
VKNLGALKGEILHWAQKDKKAFLSALSEKNCSVGRASVPAREKRPETAALPTPAIFHLSLSQPGNDHWYNTKVALI